MPDISVSVEGVDGFARALDALQQRMHTATRTATADGIRHLRQRTQGQLSCYSHPPNTPTPSPPGQPPARISGWLRGSLSPTGPTPTGGGFTGQLGPTAVYGRIQELGGQTGRNHAVTLPPRPYLLPAVRESRSDLRRIYLDAWRQAM